MSINKSSLRLKASVLAAVLLAASDVLSWAQTPQQKAWDVLRAGANDRNTDKRTHAIHALGLLVGNPAAAAIAEKALQDEKAAVRRAAATALGQMESKASIPKLQSTVNDKEVSVVLAAAHALLALKDESAYGVFYAILTGTRKSGESLLARQEDMLKNPKKLAQFGFEQGIGFVPFAGIGWSAVRAVQSLGNTDAALVRAGAAKVLANDPDPSSTEALARAVTDKSWLVRAAALDAIARRGDPALLDSAIAAMSDEKDVVNYTAAAAVIRLSAVHNKKK
jgi:HEAT repeat protein